MSFQDLGALGEIVGALAVLATLIYLAIQTRTNTIALKAQTHQQVAEARRENLKLFLDHPDLYAAVTKSHTGETLSNPDRLLLRQFTVILTRHHENELYQYSQGMIEEDEMESQRKVMLLPHILFHEIEKTASMYTPAMQKEIKLIARLRKEQPDTSLLQ